MWDIRWLSHCARKTR
ncbi:hypothetical protein ACH8KJ_004916 [Escherichia coli]